MKHQILEKMTIPQGITCEYSSPILKCKKDSTELSKKIHSPQIEIKIVKNEISIECKKGNKNHYKIIKTFLAHIKNIFPGLDEKFTYRLESVNVHFPMTLKVEGNIFIIYI